MDRRWFITGCSSGLGRALAEAVAATGAPVVATARRPETLHDLAHAHPVNVAVCGLDVRDPVGCAAAVDAAVARFGGIDVLVHNAGYGQFGAVEEVSDEELAAQFATVVFGTWRLTRLVLPLMREQRRGHLLVVSSVAGRMAFPGLGAYVAAKYALEGMAETLAVELDGTGVGVTVLEPGGYATSYGRSVVEARARLAAYEPVTGPMLAALRGLADLPAGGNPDEFAATVLRLMEQDPPPLRVPVGVDGWRLVLDALDRDRDRLRAAAVATGALTGNL